MDYFTQCRKERIIECETLKMQVEELMRNGAGQGSVDGMKGQLLLQETALV